MNNHAISAKKLPSDFNNLKILSAAQDQTIEFEVCTWRHKHLPWHIQVSVLTELTSLLSFGFTGSRMLSATASPSSFTR